MITALTTLVFLYVAGLHSSIAVMEAGGWLIAAIAFYQSWSDGHWPKFPIWKPTLGLVICVVIGLTINPLGRTFLFQIGFLRWSILLYALSLALERLWSDNFERRLLNVWIIAMGVSALYALFQTLTGIDLIRPTAHVVAFQGGGTWRPVGFFSRSLAFAYSFGLSYLALTFPLLRSKSKPIAWLVLALGALTLMATNSRGAWIGAVAAGGLYFAVARPRDLVVFGLALCGIGYLLMQTNTGMGIRLTHMLTLFADNSSMERTHIWRAYFEMWREHPFFGIGLNQGDLLVPQYYKQLGIQEEFVSNAHSVYLQWLAGAGIFALGFYLWICGYFVRAAWTLRKSSPWGWSILLAQVFLHVGAFTENNFFTAITNHMLMFCWAIVLCLERRSQQNAYL